MVSENKGTILTTRRFLIENRMYFGISEMCCFIDCKGVLVAKLTGKLELMCFSSEKVFLREFMIVVTFIHITGFYGFVYVRFQFLQLNWYWFLFSFIRYSREISPFCWIPKCDCTCKLIRMDLCDIQQKWIFWYFFIGHLTTYNIDLIKTFLVTYFSRNNWEKL